MATRILLVRHGATTLSAEDRFAGSSDVDLSDEGRAQAAALSERLEGASIAAAYCSRMKRAVETATIVGKPHGLVRVQLDGLREIDHGHWEGRVHKEVEQTFAAEYKAWDADPLLVAPPGGETGLAVLARALPALRQIVMDHLYPPNQTVLVVAHKATNRLLLSALLGIDPRFYRERLTQGLTCLNVIDFKTPDFGQVVVMNDTSHLSAVP
jgi:broad specificity phosphatase PhoE